MSSSNSASDDASKHIPPEFLSGLTAEPVQHPLNDALRRFGEASVFSTPSDGSAPLFDSGAHSAARHRFVPNHGTALVANHRWALDDIPRQCAYALSAANRLIADAGYGDKVGTGLWVSSFGRVIKSEPSKRDPRSKVLTVVSPVYSDCDDLPFSTIAYRVSTDDPLLSEVVHLAAPGRLIQVGGAMRPPPIDSKQWDSCVYVDDVSLVHDAYMLNPFCFISPAVLPVRGATAQGGMNGFLNSLVKAAGSLSQTDMQKLAAILFVDERLNDFVTFPASVNPRHSGAHHWRRHGLAVHTFQTVRSVLHSGMTLPREVQSRLMLLAWLHDIAKVELYVHLAGEVWQHRRPGILNHEVESFLLLHDCGQFCNEDDRSLRDALLRGCDPLMDMVRAADARSAARNTMILRDNSTFVTGGE